MEKFKISDIQEIFVSDVERFHSLTQEYVTRLLNEAVPSQEALDEALRQCHTLKGLAGTVEAWGLAALGADLERLLELAGAWVHHERAKANEVFEFILDHMQDWYVMNQFTCMEMLPQAWDVYQGLRGIMAERWPGYLPEPGAESVDAQYVRLTELELSELETGEASGAGAVAELQAGLDVQGVPLQAASPVAPPGAPLPVRVVPPTLRHRDGAKAGQEAVAQSTISKAATESQPDVVSPSSEVVASVEAPALPQPLQVVPPVLRRRDGASSSPESRIQNPTADVPALTTAAVAAVPAAEIVAPVVAAAAPPAGESPVAPTATAQTELTAPSAEATPALVTPPLLRVAPPALKRRGKKSALVEGDLVRAAQANEVEAASANVAADCVNPEVSVGAAPPLDAAAVLSAEAVFAALPETVEVEAAAVLAMSTAGAASPEADAELLALLGQEVAGYLTELAGCLMALAGNLAVAPPWEQARRLFHTIKGTAATFGLDAASAPAKAAEARCVVVLEGLGSGNSELGTQNLELGTGLREAFEVCVQRAAAVAKALHLEFDDGRLRAAVRAAVATAANAAALASAVRAAQANVVALDPEMAGFFINDARDQVGIIEQAVLRWERLESSKAAPAGSRNSGLGTRLECVEAAQRGFHTIKGAGNSIGLTAVAQSVHEVEAFLEGVVAQGATGSKAVFTFLLGAVDQLRRYLVALAKNTASPWRHDWSVTLNGLADLGAGRVNQEACLAAGQPLYAAGVSGLVAQAPSSGASIQMPTVAALGVAGDGAQGAAVGDESNYLRIETGRLYRLMNLISEMVIDRARLARKIEQLAGLHRALAERNGALTGSVLSFQEQFEFNVTGSGNSVLGSGAHPQDPKSQSRDAKSEFSEIEFDRYDQFNVLARSLVEISHDIEQLNGEVAGCLDSFAAENAQFTQTSQELQAQVTGLGLVPVNILFPRLQRAFRDACSVEGKEAELVLSGGEAMLDKVVVDKVYAPLLHLLRNAVAHGIEAGAARTKLKKVARGQVRLSAAQSSNQIVLVLSDDGAGVDGAAVRTRAIEKGWLAAEAPELSPERVVEFIFRPGFSTAAKVTSVSGRGIGLDVVRREVENLNGSVELKYEAGVGSTWTLRLPLTLAISEAILAEIGGTQFAFPLNFIEAGLILDPESRKTEHGVESYPVERRNVAAEAERAELATEEAGPKFDWLPVWRLSRLFGLAGDENSNKGLIVGVGDRRAIVVVDVVLRRQEVVVKQLDVVMSGHPLLNGASLDAEGRVIPILNLPTLLKFGEQWASSASRGPGVGPRVEPVKRVEQSRVLVVDDSLSVRKVQERFLRDLGCQVTVASDGLVALEKLRELEFDLIFTDLEMPRLNGYEFISEVRGNPAWSEVPVVVISSRGADKYITKAMNLGASTFLSKPFTQEQLKQVLGHYAKG